MLPHILTGTQLTVVANGKAHIVDSDHPNFNKIVEEVNNSDDFEDILELIDFKKALVKLTNGKLSVEDDRVYFDGRELHSNIVDRILHSLKFGISIDHIVKFLENLDKNPSSSSVNELYDFLENEFLPITEDGCFLGYKAVTTYHGTTKVDQFGKTITTGDLVDKYTKTIRNNIGDTPEFARNKVDDNRDRQCSHGLHIGGIQYATQSYFGTGDTVLVVKVNPADAVSVPQDHNAQKLRACKYEVMSVYTTELNKPVYSDDDDLGFDSSFIDSYTGSPIDVSQLRFGDKIKFEYAGETRHAIIDSLNSDILIQSYFDAGLLECDPNHSDQGVEWRRFTKLNMTNVKLV